MLGLTIKTIREFSLRLFIEKDFDDFLLSEARFVTDFVSEFDGHLVGSEAPGPEAATQAPASAHIPWAQLKPVAFQLIKGKKLPNSFSVNLIYPPERTRRLLEETNPLSPGEALPLLFLNIRYRQEKLTLTSGISEKGFNPHSPAAALWDRQLLLMLEEWGLSQAISEP